MASRDRAAACAMASWLPCGCLALSIVIVGATRVQTTAVLTGGLNGEGADGVSALLAPKHSVNGADGESDPADKESKVPSKWGKAFNAVRATAHAAKAKLEESDLAKKHGQNAADGENDPAEKESKEPSKLTRGSLMSGGMSAMNAVMAKTNAAKAKVEESDWAKKHGDKVTPSVMAAAGIVAGAAKRVFTPSVEMQAFVKNPTSETLAANPELLVEGLMKMKAARDPKSAAKAGIIAGFLQEAKVRAVDSKQLNNAMEAAATKAMDTKVKQATGGIVEGVPPEVSKKAYEFAKNNPEEALRLMKLMGGLTSKRG